ncbi:MAG: hypothetical protein ABGW95_00035 [Candidatus Poseidoniia archaeon]
MAIAVDQLDEAAQHGAVQLIVNSGISRQEAFDTIEQLWRCGKPGGRRAAARSSGELSFWVTVIIACGIPCSVMSAIAAKSFCCFFHQVLVSGRSAGCYPNGAGGTRPPVGCASRPGRKA